MEARSYELIPWVKPKIDIFHPIPIRTRKTTAAIGILEEINESIESED